MRIPLRMVVLAAAAFGMGCTANVPPGTLFETAEMTLTTEDGSVALDPGMTEIEICCRPGDPAPELEIVLECDIDDTRWGFPPALTIHDAAPALTFAVAGPYENTGPRPRPDAGDFQPFQPASDSVELVAGEVQLVFLRVAPSSCAFETAGFAIEVTVLEDRETVFEEERRRFDIVNTCFDVNDGTLTLDPDTGATGDGIWGSGLPFSQILTENTVTFARPEDDAAIEARVTTISDTPDPNDGDAKMIAMLVPSIASVDEFNPFSPVPVERGLIYPRSPATDVDPFTAVGLDAVDVAVEVRVDGAAPSTGAATFHYQPTRFLKELWFSQRFVQILPHVVALDGDTLYYVERDGTAQRLRRAKLQRGVTPQPEGLADIEDGWNATALIIEGDMLYLATTPEIGVKRRIERMQLGGANPVLELVIEETSTAPWQYDGLALAPDGMLYFTDSGGDYVGVIELTAVPIKAEPFAGKRFESGDVDGAGEDARLDTPETIAYHNDQLYVGANGKIKRIDPGTAQVTSLKFADDTFLAGGGSFAFDSLGNLFVARGIEGIDWSTETGVGGSWELRENLQVVILASGTGQPQAASHPAEAMLLVTDSDTLLLIELGGGAHRVAME
jgi:hypothetical protein